MEIPLPEVFNMLEQLLMAQDCLLGPHFSCVAGGWQAKAHDQLIQGNLNKDRKRISYLALKKREK